jgi:hypothetical protein
MKSFAISLLLLCLGTASIAGTDPDTAAPGLFDFDRLTEEYGEPQVMINLGGTLLGFISKLDHDDPATAEALSQLEHVRVHIYSTRGRTGAAASQIAAATRALDSDGWERVVQVREPDDYVDIYVQARADVIHGLMIMAVDGDEAVFVNVLGDIEPERLGTVFDRINVDVDLSI